jgi:hypothetical protein
MSDVERTSAGLQIVIPGCERRTLPKSTTRVDGIGQGPTSLLQAAELAREARNPRGCTFAAEQRAKGNAEKWLVRPLDRREPPFSKPRSRSAFRCAYKARGRLCLPEIKHAHTDDEVRPGMA